MPTSVKTDNRVNLHINSLDDPCSVTPISCGLIVHSYCPHMVFHQSLVAPLPLTPHQQLLSIFVSKERISITIINIKGVWDNTQFISNRFWLRKAEFYVLGNFMCVMVLIWVFCMFGHVLTYACLYPELILEEIALVLILEACYHHLHQNNIYMKSSEWHIDNHLRSSKSALFRIIYIHTEWYA